MVLYPSDMHAIYNHASLCVAAASAARPSSDILDFTLFGGADVSATKRQNYCFLLIKRCAGLARTKSEDGTEEHRGPRFEAKGVYI